jgi:hypothetical protein
MSSGHNAIGPRVYRMAAIFDLVITVLYRRLDTETDGRG